MQEHHVPDPGHDVLQHHIARLVHDVLHSICENGDLHIPKDLLDIVCISSRGFMDKQGAGVAVRITI